MDVFPDFQIWVIAVSPMLLPHVLRHHYRQGRAVHIGAAWGEDSKEIVLEAALEAGLAGQNTVHAAIMRHARTAPTRSALRQGRRARWTRRGRNRADVVRLKLNKIFVKNINKSRREYAGGRRQCDHPVLAEAAVHERPGGDGVGALADASDRSGRRECGAERGWAGQGGTGRDGGGGLYGRGTGKPRCVVSPRRRVSRKFAETRGRMTWRAVGKRRCTCGGARGPGAGDDVKCSVITCNCLKRRDYVIGGREGSADL
ncbi:hypothetical protein FB451DRAFT_1192407 [Mycena latifolia]|nr:hypothetical protein FB451DRAFT_1192407 [Mycena latifolia]